MANCWIISAAADGNPKKLKDKMEEIGDVGKFRRMCDSEIDCHGQTALHVAALMGALDMCKFLVDQVGVDINFKSHMGSTPLMEAVREGHVATAEYLIERGAEITTTDDEGLTALHLALEKEANKELAIMLLKKGADIEADSVYGMPLHYAAKHGNADMLKILIQKNAQTNSISRFTGVTPLMSAMYHYNVECVELLLEGRADANKFSFGLSPLAYAIVIKLNSCIDALLAAGADVDSTYTFDLRPIELAAVMGNREAIWILILARPRLMATPNFRLDNLLNSLTAAIQVDQKKDIHCRNFKPNGDDAWDKQDYSFAIASYTEALHYIPEDEKVLANRSLCWARMGEGVFALNDAQACVKAKPDWRKAHLGVAAAWHLLKRYRMSSDTFKRAFELDPKNEEIER